MASLPNPPVRRPSVTLGPLPLTLNYTEALNHRYEYRSTRVPYQHHPHRGYNDYSGRPLTQNYTESLDHRYEYRRSDTSLSPYPYYGGYAYAMTRNWHEESGWDTEDSDRETEENSEEEEEASFIYENVFQHLLETCIRFRTPEVMCDSVQFSFSAKEMMVIKWIVERVKDVYEQREEEREEEQPIPAEFLLDDCLFLSANRYDLALQFLEKTMDSYFEKNANVDSECLSKDNFLQAAIVKCLVASVDVLSCSHLSQKRILSFDQVLGNLLTVLRNNEIPEWINTLNLSENSQPMFLGEQSSWYW